MHRLPIAVWLLLVAFPVLPALAEDEAPPAPPAADPAVLTFEDVFGGGRTFTKPVPGWRWRPGHAQLVRLDMRKVLGGGGAAPAPDPRGKKQPKPKPRPVLVVMDPETGTTEDLLDLSSLDPLVPAMEPGPDGKPRKKRVTSMRGVGRAGPRRFTWSKRGTQLCVVVRGDLVWVDLESGLRRRLTHTETPMADLNIAPDGEHVSFSRDHELWVVRTKAGKPYPLTTGGSGTLLNGTLDWVYPEELGFRTAAWWSPDGKHLAYLQMDQSKVPTHRLPATTSGRGEGRVMRYPRAGEANPRVRVGVVPVGGGETRWVAEAPEGTGASALEYVVQVQWPEVAAVRDLGQPLVVRSNRAQSRFVGTGTKGGSVVGTGQGWLPSPRSLFPAPGVWLRRVGTGGEARWIRTDERADSTAARVAMVTPPGVDAPALLHYDIDSQRCLYAATPPGTHTQGVFVGGPGVTDLVRAPFAQDPFLWTSASIDESGTYAIVTTENATTPRRVVLARVKDGEVLRELGDARAEALDDVDLAVPEYGRIRVPGAKKDRTLGHIRWRLWKPKDFDPSKRYGLIVHTYGGPGSRMVRNTWGRGPLMPTLLCQKGFLVLQADGRGTSGQSDDWLFAVKGRLGVLEIDDQATAVQHILERGHVDPARVGIWGWSYGGTMACNGLTMRGDVFKAGVAVAPVTDWRLYDSIYTERYMGLPKDNPEGYKQSSSITHAKKLEGHLLLIHGLGDDNVHVQNSMRLAEAFIKHERTTWDLMLYAKRGHGIGGAQKDVFRRLLGWFETHLAP